MEDWERKRTEERITNLENELRELKRKLQRDEDKRNFRQGLIPMVASLVILLAASIYAVVSRLTARG